MKLSDTTYSGPALVNPFNKAALPDHVNAGTVLIEQERAIAEVKGKLSVAKMFPRNEALAFQKVMDSCSRKSLAEVAEYRFRRGGEEVNGATIRLAEEIARCWGNIDYGMRELSRGDGYSEMEAYAWDMETNTISAQRFTVNHIRDKTGGGVKVTQERDIYELTANQASRRVRERIFAVIPADLVEMARKRCRQTLAGNSERPLADRIRDMIAAFNKFGVTAQMIEARVGRKLDTITPDEIADLQSIYNSLKEGDSKVSEWFGGDVAAASLPAPTESATVTPRKPRQKAAEPAPAPEPTEEPAEAPAAAAEPAEAHAAPALAQPAPAKPGIDVF